MSTLCNECQRIVTNEPDGICVACKMLKRVNDINNKGGNMPEGVIKSKVCKRCKEDYEPTSNVQQYCPKCKEERKTEKKFNKVGSKKSPKKNFGEKVVIQQPPKIVLKENGNLSKLIECSQRLDKALEELIDTGKYDTKDIFFVRRTLGEIMIGRF